MSTPASAAPAPFLRPTPINSPRAGGARVPRLGLAIPGSAPAANGPAPAGRRPPQLKLATPGNTNNMMGPPEHRRAGSIQNAVPTSAAAQYNALSFAMGLRNQVRGSPDASNPTNGNGSLDGLDAKVNENVDYDSMDVEELPIEGWKQARETGRIIELGSLGEGAGGAVTRCTLRGGKTVFALKVCLEFSEGHLDVVFTRAVGHNNRSNAGS
jgi:mitogen-activated protein kinase kinase